MNLTIERYNNVQDIPAPLFNELLTLTLGPSGGTMYGTALDARDTGTAALVLIAFERNTSTPIAWLLDYGQFRTALFVEKKYRHKGIASKLLKIAEQVFERPPVVWGRWSWGWDDNGVEIVKARRKARRKDQLVAAKATNALTTQSV